MGNEVYTNLLTALEQDAIEIQRTLELLNRSLKTQRSLILSESNQYSHEFNQSELDTLLGGIVLGVMSFFPKTIEIKSDTLTQKPVISTIKVEGHIDIHLGQGAQVPDMVVFPYA